MLTRMPRLSPTPPGEAAPALDRGPASARTSGRRIATLGATILLAVLAGLAVVHHRGWLAVHSSSIASDWLVTLEVVGRKSGKLIALPVVLARVDGERYLVSMLGTQAQWVLNVQAAHGKAYLRSGRRHEVHLEDVPVAQRASILLAYIKRAPGARPHMLPLTPQSPLADFERSAAEYPVFRIVNGG